MKLWALSGRMTSMWRERETEREREREREMCYKKNTADPDSHTQRGLFVSR